LKRIHFLCGLLCLLALATMAGAQSNSDEPDLYLFKLPEADWAVEASLPGFATLGSSQEQLRNELTFITADLDTGVCLELLLAEHQQEMTSEACRDHYWDNELYSPYFDDVRQDTAAGLPMMEWYLKGKWKGLKVNQRNLGLFLARGSCCVRAHIYKANYRKRDSGQLDQVLESIRLVEHFPNEPADLPPHQSELPVDPVILQERLDSSNYLVRLYAVESIQLHSKEEFISPLRKIARNRRESLSLRAATAEALASMGSIQIEVAVDLLTSKDSGAKATGVMLIRQAGEAAVPALGRVLRQDKLSRAAELLGEIGSPEAVRVLTAALDDRDKLVRSYAMEALLSIGGPEVLEVARRYVSDPILGFSAAQVLGEVGGPQEVDLLIGVVEQEERDTGARLIAIRSLANIGDPRATEPLTRAVARYPDRQKQEPALALAMLGQPGERSLLRLLDHDDPFVNFFAAQGLSLLRGKTIDLIFARAVRVGDLEVVSGGYLYYIRSGTTEAVGMLIEGLDQYGDLRMANYFKGCGQPELVRTADRWAKANHTELRFSDEAPAWGSEPPDPGTSLEPNEGQR
jgi:HEAT repeat protein